jgi:zinc transport system substrate-binding protein
VWLDPVLMREIVGKVGEALAGVDATNTTAYRRRASVVQQQLTDLDASYRATLATCALKTMVTTHEAFGYLAKRYGLTQLGLTGLTPEAEPSAAQLRNVRELARDRKIAAVFVEATDEGRRIGRSVAGDVDVPALDLNTLESDPKPEEYFSQMRENLANLKEGLRCN